MAAMFDMKMIGDKEVVRAMQGLPKEVQVKVMRGSLRKSAERLKNQILLNASGLIVKEDTGAMVAAFEATRIGTRVRPGGTVAFVKLPSRAALGIPRSKGRDPAKDTEYYPTILEFGQPTQPPRPFMRKAVNDLEDEEYIRMGRDIGKGTTRAWRRLNRASA